MSADVVPVLGAIHVHFTHWDWLVLIGYLLLTTWVGLLLGNVAGFALARYASDRFRSKLPPHPESTTVALVFVTRPVPVVAEAMSLAAGATTISTAHFLLASAAGNFVYALVLSANGSALVPESVIGWGLLVPFLFPVLAWFGWRYYAQRVPPT